MIKQALRCFAVLFFALAVAADCPGDDRPNIVVILCDDLGYGDLECYGHPHIKTPHLNRLAETGIRFTDFYSAAPVCSPSRVGLLTGRSPNRAGVYDWIPPASNSSPDARHKVHMRESEVTIPQLLLNAGYQTCLAGKWHCNSRFNQQQQPQPGDFGFQHWFATQNNAAPSHQNPKNFVRNGDQVGKLEGFSCQLVVDEATAWLETTDREQTFFLFLAFHEPHEPVASPENLVTQYRRTASSDDQAQYFANVANVDAAVGRFVAALEKLNRRANTLIVFTSDNGPETLNRYRTANRSHGTPGPLRGMKLHTHDAGFRVAGIMNWQGRIKPEQTSNAVISSLDFLPTFCALADANVPSDLKLDGTNILPALDGKQVDRAKPLAWAYFNGLNEARVAMRDGKWKVLAQLRDGDGKSIPRLQNVTSESLPIVRDAQLTDLELYDLTTDISEAKNLALDDPELAKRMLRKLERAYRELVNNSHVWAAGK
ncbi:MAG: sulfatase-like hydrolase/transferase [Planctomycetales bacterium]|nr:sulfatase-like hydrolase/transferase [Planctomycetales bacterium]